MKKIFVRIGKHVMTLITKISPNISCRLLFFMRIKKLPNLKKPQTFNEKTTWLKMNKYYNDSLVIQCADKYNVRSFVKKSGYEKILNELYGVYDNFDDIDFEQLPNQFVLKCTHGCAYNIICQDKSKFDIIKARKKVNKWMNEKYGYATTELHYTRIKPKIIIEKYLCDDDGRMPIDYKFYCFHGCVHCVLVCTNRENHDYMNRNIFDTNWNELNYVKENYRNHDVIQKPSELNNMIKVAEQLSKKFPFVRVDLYNKNGNIIFGELTFTPACCCNPLYNKIGDIELGKLLSVK